MNNANLTLSFHHIGKPVPLMEIKDNEQTRYSPLFDMYTFDILNDLSLPIQLHAFGPSSSLNVKIQTESHGAFKVSNIQKALQGKQIVMPLYEPFAG
ncbi:hypothetical protein [Leuconostoc palmae]|uniref:hypothetical protein n=1 Tax=Leuconostoc palmae TaxID=501487 RepID=UPI001FE971F7|nr:hypothetical protein [Leuconostoc palmae]